MSSLIYLSHKNDEVILDKDFQFVVLHNGLNLLSESTYRLMMGQLADICQTEKQVPVALLKQWIQLVELELGAYLAYRDDEQDSIIDVLTELKTLLTAINQESYPTIISCCV